MVILLGSGSGSGVTLCQVVDDPVSSRLKSSCLVCWDERTARSLLIGVPGDFHVVMYVGTQRVENDLESEINIHFTFTYDLIGPILPNNLPR